MKAKGLGLALAVGLLVVALWVALHPTGPASPANTSPASNRAADVPPQAVQTATPAPGQPSGREPSATPPPAVAPPTPSTITDLAPVSPVPDLPAAPPVEAGGKAPVRDASIDVNKVQLMMRDFHTRMGENPVGTNAEIMRALMGGNPKQATFGPPEGMSLNGNGELVDQWGTPYFFHQLSKDVMEIHSAGPDKVMGTPDDVVTR